jgi:hypothetical protein
VWQVASTLCGDSEWGQYKSKYVKDQHGTLATSPLEQVRNFVHHSEPTYNATPPSRSEEHKRKFQPRSPGRSYRPPQKWAVLRAIRALKDTSSGRTGVPLQVWRSMVLHGEGLDVVTKIMQDAWAQETVPKAWKTAHMLALYKKYDPTLPKNYRLIFIEEHLSKLFQKLLVQYLDDHFEDIAPEFSNGFRRARGCTDALGDAHGSAHSGVTHAFKHVAETRSRLANVVGKGRLSLRDFHPEV